jgi:predicted DNA-binding transcriptional regulator AlpA
MIDKMLDVNAVAILLGASVRTVWRLVATKVLPKPVRVGESTRWFESDVEEFQRKLKERRERD